MKFKSTQALFAFWLALALALLPSLRAASFAEEPETKQATPPAPAEHPAVKVEETPEASETRAAVAVTPAEDKKADGQLRELEADDQAAVETPRPATKEAKAKSRHVRIGRAGADNARVNFFINSTLAAGEEADAVVSILGSSTSAGKVRDAVVSVLGSSTSSGEVGNAVVSVIGDTRVTGGTVGDTAVAVLGSAYVNGHVKGEVVSVLGNVELGPDAVVDGNIVCVGGEVKQDGKAVLHGTVQNIAIGGHHFNFDGLHAWFEQCFLYGRPLAFGEHLMWAWWIALACLGFYALLALLAPAGVTKCVQTLEERPGKSILSGVLTLLLTPVAYLLLVLTLAIGIGFVLIPLFSLGLFFAGIFGKVVMLAWLGRRITKLFGDGRLAQPVIAVLIGGILVLLLYTIPILGFVVYKLIGVLGLGVVVYTLLLSLKGNRAATKAAAASAAASAAVPPVVAVASGETSVPLPPAIGGEAPPAPTIPGLPPVISAATLPRAGFWIRLGAAALDAMLVFLFSLFFKVTGWFPFWFVGYHVVLWATKGTTIGGIICGLKVVRLDDRPIDWSIAVVRALSAFLSLVGGLGFIWVVFDDEKQSWHDKIAGTTIVKVPKVTPLV